MRSIVAEAVMGLGRCLSDGKCAVLILKVQTAIWAGESHMSCVRKVQGGEKKGAGGVPVLRCKNVRMCSADIPTLVGMGDRARALGFLACVDHFNRILRAAAHLRAAIHLRGTL